jgi:hypothetical protein
MPRKYDNKEKEARLLGMPWTTAATRLQRMLLYALADECGKLDCYRCGERIDSVQEFSIEHIVSWLDSPNLYWDLTNIAFSHMVCNRKAGRKHGGGSCPISKARWKARFEKLGEQAIASENLR